MGGWGWGREQGDGSCGGKELGGGGGVMGRPITGGTGDGCDVTGWAN